VSECDGQKTGVGTLNDCPQSYREGEKATGMPGQSRKRFTLIELSIVIATLCVLTAMVVPNMNRFFGSGEDDSRRTEKHNVQLAVGMMMTENRLDAIPNPVDMIPTNDMTVFPDATSVAGSVDKLVDPEGYAYADTDANGHVLSGHDITGSDAGDPNPEQTDVNYMPTHDTQYFYTVDADGTVHQWADVVKTGGELTD